MSCNCPSAVDAFGPYLGQYRFEPESRLEGWTEDANAAMAANPSYFTWWYSAKSIALVGVACTLAYYIGKNARSSRRRRR